MGLAGAPMDRNMTMYMTMAVFPHTALLSFGNIPSASQLRILFSFLLFLLNEIKKETVYLIFLFLLTDLSESLEC